MPKPKPDFTQVAHRVFQRAIGEAPTDQPAAEDESPKARAGRVGGKKGGPSRAAKLTPEERSDIAARAAEARWSGKRKP